MRKKIIMVLLLVFCAAPAFAQVVDTAWVRIYNGPVNLDDDAEDIEVDNYGNVYVTGTSYDSITGRDYATIKYDPNGDTAWIRRCSGAGRYPDYARAIALDDYGNVYVTGWSGDGGNGQWLTVKYDQTGNELWTRRTNEYSGGKPGDLIVDDSGNVFITGIGSDPFGDPLTTIKYYTNGDTAWITRISDDQHYAYGTAIVLDEFRNVYVTGFTGVFGSYITIMYNPDGDTVWMRKHTEVDSGQNAAIDVALDTCGNVYVTGYTSGFVTPTDYLTIKYDSQGNELWVRRYNGPGNLEDYAVAIAVDRSGDAYVTGYSYGSGTAFDYATIKYFPNGDTAWIRRYNGLGNSDDQAYAVALDDSGNVYVTGYSYNINWEVDYATIKYRPNGDIVWVRRDHLPQNPDTWVHGLAVDSSDNVYVTGCSSDTLTGHDYTTIKYVQMPFLRGDANKDGVVDVGDVVYLINYLFKGGLAPNPLLAGDTNCDGTVDIGDVVYLINYLFKSGPASSC